MNRNKIEKKVWDILNYVYNIIKPIVPLRILVVFLVKDLFLAFGKYSKIKHIYGEDCVICSCAYFGTGDYYFTGMYLRAWLKKNMITNYIFCAPTSQQLRVMKLFDYMYSHAYKLNQNWYLNGFKHFLGNYPVDYYYFLYVGGGASNTGFLEMYPNASLLFGYKGFNIIDCYLRLGLNLHFDTVPEPAKFSDDADALGELISLSRAIREKTVLISPYAVSNDSLSTLFWGKIVKTLKQRGYCVLTNAGNNQRPLKGTKALFLPYVLSVPFLNYAGGFIGVRSGLCDIISTSSCKKVIIHPYYSINWPNGTSLGFTGLKNMGICDDAVELVFTEKNANESKVIQAVLAEFP